MIIDNEMVLKADQALTADASTSSIDLVAGGLEAKPAFLRALITTAGAGTGTVSFQVSSSADNSTFKVVAASEAFVGTALTKGKVIKVPIPADMGRYLKGTVDVTGTVSAGVAFLDVTVN
jgi:hypothetical protein